MESEKLGMATLKGAQPSRPLQRREGNSRTLGDPIWREVTPQKVGGQKGKSLIKEFHPPLEKEGSTQIPEEGSLVPLWPNPDEN